MAIRDLRKQSIMLETATRHLETREATELFVGTALIANHSRRQAASHEKRIVQLSSR